jgi:ATP-binding cassette, subfamily B (MDR/TAP), member 1
MFMIYAAYALAFWYGIHLYSRGEVHDAGKIITTLFAIIVGTNAFAALATYLGPFFRIFSAAAELFQIIDTKSEDHPSQGSAFVKSQGQLAIDHSKNSPKDIEFENVSFSYPLRPAMKVLSKFSLKMAANKTTAFVGPSGSGKSTIVALLERWYEPNEGIIRIGGRKVTELSLGTVRGCIGLVQQV